MFEGDGDPESVCLFSLLLDLSPKPLSVAVM